MESQVNFLFQGTGTYVSCLEGQRHLQGYSRHAHAQALPLRV